MTSDWLRIALCVPAAKVNNANTLAARFDPDQGDGNSFTVRLSPTGQEPPTHYATEALFRPATRAALMSLKAGAAIPEWLLGDVPEPLARETINAILIGDGFSMAQLMSAHQLLKIPELV